MLGVLVDVSDYLSQSTVVQTRSVFGVISGGCQDAFRRFARFSRLWIGGSEGLTGCVRWGFRLGVGMFKTRLELSSVRCRRLVVISY